MELGFLKEFVVLAQTGNFLEAAELLFISQSTLSKHIKKMEAELGIPLFDRTTRRVELNRYGQLMLPYAKRMVQLRKAYTDDLQTLREREQNSLEIGSIPALVPYNITDLLVRFRRECGEIALNVTQTGTPFLKELLLSGACELAFLREVDAPEDELERIPYDRDSLTAVLPKGHPLAAQGPLPLSRLREEELLLVERGTMLHDLCCDACRRSGFEPRVAFTDHNLEHLVDFAQKGMGVALLMKKLATCQTNQNVAVVDLTPELSTDINLCYKKGAKLSPAATHFLQYVRTHASH